MELIESFATPGRFSQSAGKIRTSPKRKRIPPERYFQNSGGTMMSAVENLRRYVKRIIESARDPTTIYGVHLLLPVVEVPMTTGRSGKIHGARTVRTPAMNEMARSVMLFYFQNEFCKSGASAPFSNEIALCVNLDERVLICHSVFLLKRS